MFFPNTSIRYDFIQLLNMPYVNRVNLREQNLSLKCCQSLEQKLCDQQGQDLSKTVSLCRSMGCKVTSCQTFEDDPIVQESNQGRPHLV